MSLKCITGFTKNILHCLMGLIMYADIIHVILTAPKEIEWTHMVIMFLHFTWSSTILTLSKDCENLSMSNVISTITIKNNGKRYIWKFTIDHYKHIYKTIQILQQKRKKKNREATKQKLVNLNPTTSIFLLIVYRLKWDCQNGQAKKTQLLVTQFKYREAKKQKRIGLNHKMKTKHNGFINKTWPISTKVYVWENSISELFKLHP